MQHFEQIPGYSHFSLFSIGFLCSKSRLWTQKCQFWKRYKNTPGARNITQKWIKWQKEGFRRVLSLLLELGYFWILDILNLDIVKRSDALPALLFKNLWRCQTFSAGVIWLVLPWSTGKVQRWPGTAHPQIFFCWHFQNIWAPLDAKT